MKLVLPLLLVSTMVHATCKELEIKVINNSVHNCTFKNKVMYYGTLQNEKIPPFIPAGQSSPAFSARQDNVGVGVLLTYNCDNETVKFYSWQEYCGFSSGSVGGKPQTESTLNLEYEADEGSALVGRPGRITWRIS